MKNLKNIIEIPGSKSYTNRALLLAALTKGKVKINNPLISDDTIAMINCLKTLGIKIIKKKDSIEVIGDIFSIENKKYKLNANLSGTTIRFITALSAVTPGVKVITGKDGLNKRPIKDLVNSLKQLGVKISYLEKDGFPPLFVEPVKSSKKNININGSVSSQYLSAILMVAPVIGGITINVVGKQISKPYVDMTIDIMKKFDASVINKNYKKYIISGNQKYSCSSYDVEGDFSSAGYFFATAALTKSKIVVKNLNPDSKQADKKLLNILEKMGSKITYKKNEIVINGNGVKALDIDVLDFPDQAQTLAVLAAFAHGKTKLIGVKSLRIKETERVIALQNELKKMNIKTLATKDSLTVFGGAPKAAEIETCGDHRMAMAFAIAKNILPKIVIKNPEVVNKTFPDFWKKMEEINL